MPGRPKHREQGSFQSHWHQNYPRHYHLHHLTLTTERVRCYYLYLCSKSYSSQSSSVGLRRCFFASSSQVVFSHHVPIRDGPRQRTPGGGAQGPKRRGKGEPGVYRYWYSSRLLGQSGKVAKLLANCFYFANAFDFRGDWYLPTNKNRNETRMLSFPTLCHKKMLA